MKTMVYLIRHGETNWNAEHRVQGCYDGLDQSVLTENGKRQAELLKSIMSDVRIDIVYSSPLKRTAQTAEIIFPRHNINFHPNLIERCFGEWQCLTRTEIDIKWPGKFDFYHKTLELNGVKEAETHEHLTNRGVSAIKEIVTKYPGKNIAIISHGGTSRAAISKLLKFSYEKMLNFRLHNTAVTILEFENSHVKPILINDHTHLV